MRKAAIIATAGKFLATLNAILAAGTDDRPKASFRFQSAPDTGRLKTDTVPHSPASAILSRSLLSKNVQQPRNPPDFEAGSRASAFVHPVQEPAGPEYPTWRS
jgi:hypothetical protein